MKDGYDMLVAKIKAWGCTRIMGMEEEIGDEQKEDHSNGKANHGKQKD